MLFAAGTIVLFGAAMQTRNTAVCKNVVIHIKGADEHLFIDENQIIQYLQSLVKIEGAPLQSIPLRKLEESLEKNPWIYQAELFFDNLAVLNINIIERQPIARIFTLQGNSFYIDSGAIRLPLSNKLSAKVPYFTGFASDQAVLSRPDSLVLNDIKIIGRALANDSFMLAQTSQINVLPNRTFEIIPLIGNQTILLGRAEKVEEKFNNLFSFYKQVWGKSGFETYSKIDLRFDGQVVATRRFAKQPAGLLPQPQDNLPALPDSVVENSLPAPVATAVQSRQPQKKDSIILNKTTIKQPPQPKAVMKKKQ